MYSKIIINKSRVKIYFKHKPHFIRYNTGIPAESKDLFNRKDPNLLFKPIDKLHEDYNKQIKNIKNIIDKIIEENLYKSNTKIDTQYVAKIIEASYGQTELTKKFLIEYYEDFLNYKDNYLREHNYSLNTIKDYNSLKQSLIDYSMFCNKLFEIKDINYDWVKDFLLYLTQKHQKSENYSSLDDNLIKVIQRLLKDEPRKYKYRFKKNKIIYATDGELSDNTTQKRYDNLHEFITYLYKKEIIDWHPEIIKDIRKMYKSYNIAFTTLTIEELKMIYEYPIDFDYQDKRYHYVRDVFVLMALTSLRFSDIITIDKRRDIYNDRVIRKTTQKTENYDGLAVITITPTIREILEKYNYRFDRFSNAEINEHLKDFFRYTGLFNDDFFPRKKVLGKDIKKPAIKRWEAISTHTGRRSAVTNLISQNFNDLRITSMTGHKSPRMLKIYHDAHRNNNLDNDILSESLDFQCSNE